MSKAFTLKYHCPRLVNACYFQDTFLQRIIGSMVICIVSYIHFEYLTGGQAVSGHQGYSRTSTGTLQVLKFNYEFMYPYQLQGNFQVP